MDYFDCNFDAGFDLDFSGMDDEDFGLAKCFTTAPIGLITPGVSLESQEEPNIEKECMNSMNNEIKADGFCFKLHPTEDQVQFQRDLK